MGEEIPTTTEKGRSSTLYFSCSRGEMYKMLRILGLACLSLNDRDWVRANMEAKVVWVWRGFGLERRDRFEVWVRV